MERNRALIAGALAMTLIASVPCDAEQLYLPKLVSPNDAAVTTLTLINSSAEAADVRIVFRTASGMFAGAANRTVRAQDQLVTPLVEVRPNAEPVWICISTETAGLRVTSGTGDFRRGFEISAAQPAAPHLALLRVTPDSTLFVANASNYPDIVSLTLMSTDGVALDRSVRAIPARGAWQGEARSVFEHRSWSGAAHVQLLSTAIAATAVFPGETADRDLSSLNAVPLGDERLTTLYGALTIDGDDSAALSGMETWLGVTNFHRAADTISIAFNGADGRTTTVERQVMSQASLRVRVRDLFETAIGGTGWIRIQGTSLNGYLSYENPRTGAQTSVLLRNGLSHDLTLGATSRLPLWDSEIALTNPGPEPIDVDLTYCGGIQPVVDADGGPAIVTVRIPARRAFLFRPDAVVAGGGHFNPGIGGTIRISTHGPQGFAAVQLYFNPELTILAAAEP